MEKVYTFAYTFFLLTLYRSINYLKESCVECVGSKYVLIYERSLRKYTEKCIQFSIFGQNQTKSVYFRQHSLFRTVGKVTIIVFELFCVRFILPINQVSYHLFYSDDGANF